MVHKVSKRSRWQSPYFITKGASKQSDGTFAQTIMMVGGAIKSMTAWTSEVILAANDGLYQTVACFSCSLVGPRKHHIETLVDMQTLEENMVFWSWLRKWSPCQVCVVVAMSRANIRIITVTRWLWLWRLLVLLQEKSELQGDDARVVSGLELADMGWRSLQEALKVVIVFARVAPEQKYRNQCNFRNWVKLLHCYWWWSKWCPALESADIVAMGMSELTSPRNQPDKRF